jgi:peptidoglycan/LPS O-acetylase OafA/YrhL
LNSKPGEITIRLKGLGTIRFLCATIVLFGHIGFPLAAFFLLHPQSKLATALGKSVGLVFNGPAAVIVFFIISGLCIHLPHANGKPILLSPYYAKRLIRAGVPGSAAAALLIYFQGSPASWQDTVMWSIFCEVIYYAIYPVLLLTRLKTGWLPLIIASGLLSLSISLLNGPILHAANNSYVAFGGWTWIIGLPCWMLGCALAESHSRFPLVSRHTIWKIRIAVFLCRQS